MHDLLVIGAGLSGLIAALTAAQAGQKTHVICKGMGATHWHAGVVDLLGYLSGSDQAVAEPWNALTKLPPEHPYRRIGVQGVQEALAAFQSSVAAANLVYAQPAQNTRPAARNMLLPSPVGALRPAYLVPQAQWAGEIACDLAGEIARDAPMLIVGFRGMRDFYPMLIAENLGKQGFAARAEFLPLSLLTDRRDSNMVQIAEAVDNAARRHHLGAALSKLVHPGERIGLPAILGLEQHALTLAELQWQVGAPIFEIPTLPPSVPGIRLYRALRSELQKHQVRIEANMEVIDFQATGKRIEWVETATSARSLRHHAKNFLLATGGVLGGGFNSDAGGRFWEVVFHLPLTTPQDRRQWFRARFLDPDGQPVFQGGVAVNDRFQPVSESGDVVYENLWAAGGVLAHADPIRERSLEGLAIATGYAAAQAIVKRR
jgi:glycerol-3-phosphate dehydrogenase subunit B